MAQKTYNYYISLGIQEYNKSSDEWVITHVKTIEAQVVKETSKAFFDYSDANDTKIILDNVLDFTSEQSKKNREPQIRYNSNVDKVLGYLTESEPYLTVYVDYKQYFEIKYYYYKDGEEVLEQQGKKYVEQAYTIRNTTVLKNETYEIWAQLDATKEVKQKDYYHNVIAYWIDKEKSTDIYHAGDIYTGNADLNLYLDKENSWVWRGNYLDDIISPSRNQEKDTEGNIFIKLQLQGGELLSGIVERFINGYKSFHFLGWSFAEDGEILPDGYSLSAPISGNKLVIYPVWQETPYQRSLLSLQNELPTPIRAGYRFKMWSARAQEEYLTIFQDNVTGQTGELVPYNIFALWQSELEYANEYEQTIRKVPYKIEVWEDQFNDKQNCWEEVRLVTLGADTMEDQGRAFDIKFKQTVYGELTLTFSLFGTYIDNQTGLLVENYLMKYCFNEAKIKLQYDNEWYDFIIKNIQETHNQQFTKTYTCQYLPIYELSKIGYTQVFSLDNRDGSGIQSAPEFMETILEDTEWRYVQAGDASVPAVKNLEVDLSESSEEIVYSTPILPDSALKYYTFTIDKEGQLHKSETSFTQNKGKIYIPNSQLEKKDEIFGCFSEDEIKVDGDLILKSNLVLFTMDWAKYPISSFSITGLTMQVPKKNAVSEWIDAPIKIDGDTIETISQYCNKGYYLMEVENGEDGNNTIKTQKQPAYYRVKTATTNNAENYELTDDKFPCYFGVIDSTTYGFQHKLYLQAKADLQEGRDTRPYYALTNGDYYYLFQLKNIIAEASGAQDTLVELPIGTEYRYYCVEGNNAEIVVVIGTVYDGDDAHWEPSVGTMWEKPNGSLGFSFRLQGFNPDIEKNETKLKQLSQAIVLGASPKTYYKKTGNDGDNVYYRPYTDLAIPSSENFPQNFYEVTAVSTDITSESSQVHSIRQYFIVDNNTKEAIVLGNAPSDEVGYFYKKDKSGIYYYDSVLLKYTLSAPPSWKMNDARYTRVPFYQEQSYIMYRSLESSNSNCFDLTQKVAETFGVWCKYIIEHDEDGRIIYDNTDESFLEPRRKKWVTLTSYAGAENPIGFTYGINLTNLSRTIKTDSLVTKLYVDYSENNYTPEGYVAISNAADNISKENVLYNFDYYIQVGLLDKMKVYRDFYQIEKEEDVGRNPIEIQCVIEPKPNEQGNYPEKPVGAGYLRLLGLLNTQYDKISETINGEQGYSYQVIHLKEMLSAYEYARAFTVDSSIQGQNTAPSIGSSPDEDLATLQRLTKEYNRVSAQLAAAKKQLAKIVTRKQELERKFNQRYARYIQEGNWTSSDYIDSDSYYADALKVSNDGAKPNVTYNFTAIDLYALPEYKDYKFCIGDRTWVEDTEYFGYEEDGTPYHESVILTEINYDLDNASASTFAVQNYSNKFDDLFQTLSATANSFSLNQQMYGRASKLLTSGGLDDETTQKSLISNKELTLMQSSSIQFDNDGIIFSNVANPNQILRIGSDGISMSDNGGVSYDQRLMW